MTRNYLARIAAAFAAFVGLFAINVPSASAQCVKCWTGHCAYGPWQNGNTDCDESFWYCLSWGCCEGSGCDTDEAAVASIGLSGVGGVSALGYAAIGVTFTDLQVHGLPGIGVARNCGGLILGIRFEQEAAAAMRRRLTRIIV
jgi:hypothetical protein